MCEKLRQERIARKRKERKDDNELTKHHIINRCRKEEYDCLHCKDNIHIYKRRDHENHHIAQWNNTPLETLRHYEFFKQVMSPQAQALYDALISMNEYEFYKRKFTRK